VRIVFVDESYSDGHYFIGALLIKPENVRLLELALDRLMAEISSEHSSGILPNEEFHGTDLFSGKGIWREITKGERYINSVLDRAFQVLSNIEFSILLQGLNKRQLENRYSLQDDPHRITLKILIEKIDQKLEDFDSFGIIICDERGSALEKDTYRELLREVQVRDTDGLYARKVVRVVDTLHFVSSKKSRSIQAIDLITFLHRRISVHTHASNAENEFTQMLWTKVKDKIVYQGIWAP
jgi:hypothetical protein